jgi:uncharacterized protein YcfJ
LGRWRQARAQRRGEGNEHPFEAESGECWQQVEYQTVRQDTTTFREEERIQGYRVTYVYADREYVTTMASHPGTSIPVRVTVLPSTGNF